MSEPPKPTPGSHTQPTVWAVILAGASTAVPLRLFAEFRLLEDLGLIIVLGLGLCQLTFAAYVLVHARWNLVWRTIWFVVAIGHAGYAVSEFEEGNWREGNYLTFFTIIALIATIIFATYQFSRWRTEGTLQFSIATLLTITTAIAILLGAGLSVGWIAPPERAYALAISMGVGGSFAGEIGRRWYERDVRRVLVQSICVSFSLIFANRFGSITLFASVIQAAWMFICCLSVTRLAPSSETTQSDRTDDSSKP